MGWHARTAQLIEAGGPELESALLLLEHAASGLLHEPAGTDHAGVMAVAEVHLAVFRLHASGVQVGPVFEVGPDWVELAEVRPLLVAAEERLVTAVQRLASDRGPAVDPEPVAYAAMYTRLALTALDRGTPNPAVLDHG